MSAHHVKYLPLLVLVLLGAWLLPPPVDEDRATTDADTSADEPRYVIKFAPGWAYLPDTHPFGIGEHHFAGRTIAGSGVDPQ